MNSLTPRIILGGLLLLASSSLRAQKTQPIPQGAKEVPVRNLAVCFLFATTTPEIYYKDAKEDYQPLRIDTARFESWNQIPAGTELILYRKLPPLPPSGPATSASPAPTIGTQPPTVKPKYEPIQTWILPGGTESIRKLYYYSSSGQVQQLTFKCVPESHSALQIRTINLLEDPAIIQVGERTTTIRAGEENIMQAASTADDRFNFRFGYQPTNGQSYASPLIYLQFVAPTQRLTTILGYSPVTDPLTSNVLRYDASAIRFYEDVASLPATPKPAIVYPKK